MQFHRITQLLLDDGKNCCGTGVNEILRNVNWNEVLRLNSKFLTQENVENKELLFQEMWSQETQKK